MRTSRAWAAIAVLGAVGLGVGTLTAPAVAASAPGTATSSPNRAGYVVVRADAAIHHARAEWVVPSVTCGKTDARAEFLVRLSGQVGGHKRTVPFAAGTTAVCSGGNATYFGWINVFGRSRLPVRAGDTIKADIFCGYQEADLSIEDLTSGAGAGAGAADIPFPARHRAYFIAKSATTAGDRQPLADFGRLRFTRASVGAATLDQLAATRVVMRSAEGVTRAVPGALGAQGAFDVVWRHR